MRDIASILPKFCQEKGRSAGWIRNRLTALAILVGVRGFEPPTTCTPYSAPNARKMLARLGYRCRLARPSRCILVRLVSMTCISVLPICAHAGPDLALQVHMPAVHGHERDETGYEYNDDTWGAGGVMRFEGGWLAGVSYLPSNSYHTESVYAYAGYEYRPVRWFGASLAIGMASGYERYKKGRPLVLPVVSLGPVNVMHAPQALTGTTSVTQVSVELLRWR